MIRRSFRIGMWLGVLAGIGLAVVKMVQRARPAPEPPRWAPLERPAPTRVPTPRVVDPQPAPVVPQPEPEPVVPSPEPAPIVPEPEPEPVVPPPAPEPLVPEPPPAPRAAKKAAKQPVKVAKKVAAAKKATVPRKRTLPPWVDPQGGICPGTHPVKAKLASGIFHLPGGFSYDRTSPDRCYQTPSAAEADGLRPSKR